MRDNPKPTLVTVCSETIGKPNNFTVAMDAKTNQPYTFEETEIKTNDMELKFQMLLVQ